MWETLKKHFTLTELKSILQTFVSNLMVDASVGVAFHSVVGGDWSSAALIALANCLGRSLLKAVWSVLTTESLSDNSQA